MTVSEASSRDPRVILISVGPYVQEMFEAIEEMAILKSKEFGEDKYLYPPIVVAGYPPHLVELIQHAREQEAERNKKGSSLKMLEFKLLAVVGGESISEAQRAKMLAKTDAVGNKGIGFNKVYSSYGASDLDINIAIETEFEQELRLILSENKEFARKLLGEHSFPPSVFHNDPYNYYIEHDKDNNLIFTSLRNKRISPRLKYLLGDKGRAIPVSHVTAMLQEFGIEVKNPPKHHFPLLFVWGRGESMVTYRGANLAPENLGDALKNLGVYEKLNHFGILQYQLDGENRLIFMLETNDQQLIQSYPDDTFRKELLLKLGEVNQDFKKQLECSPEKSWPALKIFTADKSPMSWQRQLYPHAKKKYIYFEGEEILLQSGFTADQY